MFDSIDQTKPVLEKWKPKQNPLLNKDLLGELGYITYITNPQEIEDIILKVNVFVKDISFWKKESLCLYFPSEEERDFIKERIQEDLSKAQSSKLTLDRIKSFVPYCTFPKYDKMLLHSIE
jgi:hypothetical protein